MTNDYDLSALSDAELVGSLDALVGHDRQTTARLLAHLAEVDERRLYSRDAFSSLFDYCTRRLRMAEGSAYKRIRAARAARKWPVIFGMVARGDLHISAVVLLSAHLTDANHRDLLAAAVHESKSAVEKLLAARFPSPDAPTLIRRLPAPQPPRANSPEVADGPSGPPTTTAPARLAAPPAAPPRAIVAPLAPERFKVQFTAGAELTDKLRRAQDLLRHRLPHGDIASIFERALDSLLRELERERFAKTDRPRAQPSAAPGSRHIPNAIRREVAARDGMRCTFVDADGRRCGSTSFLEFHHVVPWALGGETTAANVRLFCKSHNREAAERDFGRQRVRALIDTRRAARQSELFATVPRDSSAQQPDSAERPEA